MNRRYGLFEPATFVCAAVLLWPFVYGDMQLLPRAFALLPRPPTISAAACLIVQIASIAMVGLQLLIAYVVAFQLCRWLQSHVVWLNLPQLRLTTVIVLTVLAGVLVGLFVELHRAWLAKPEIDGWQWAGEVWTWIPPSLVLLFGVCQSCETALLGTLPSASSSTDDAAAAVYRWWTAQWEDTSEPTLRERVLYALPLLCFIALVVIAPSLIAELNFRGLRVDLPALSRPVVYWTGRGHAYLCASLVVVLGVYIAWLCRSRKRMALFALLLLLMLTVSLFALLVTLIVPILEMGSRRRKK